MFSVEKIYNGTKTKPFIIVTKKILGRFTEKKSSTSQVSYLYWDGMISKFFRIFQNFSESNLGNIFFEHISLFHVVFMLMTFGEILKISPFLQGLLTRDKSSDKMTNIVVSQCSSTVNSHLLTLRLLEMGPKKHRMKSLFEVLHSSNWMKMQLNTNDVSGTYRKSYIYCFLWSSSNHK